LAVAARKRERLQDYIQSAFGTSLMRERHAQIQPVILLYGRSMIE
jgi:hypothetical protein